MTRPSGHHQIPSVGDRVTLRSDPGMMGIVETNAQHEGDTVRVYWGTIDGHKVYKTYPLTELDLAPDYAQLRRCIECHEWIVSGTVCEWCSTHTKIGKDEKSHE